MSQTWPGKGLSYVAIQMQVKSSVPLVKGLNSPEDHCFHMARVTITWIRILLFVPKATGNSFSRSVTTGQILYLIWDVASAARENSNTAVSPPSINESCTPGLAAGWTQEAGEASENLQTSLSISNPPGCRCLHDGSRAGASWGKVVLILQPEFWLTQNFGKWS